MPWVWLFESSPDERAVAEGKPFGLGNSIQPYVSEPRHHASSDIKCDSIDCGQPVDGSVISVLGDVAPVVEKSEQHLDVAV